MADQEGDIFPQMEREICECFRKLFQLITERKELLLRKLHYLKEEFEKQNTSNRNKIEQLASSKSELERVCQSLRGNPAVVQVEKGITDLENEIRTVREEIRIPELSYHYSLNRLRECISQFGEIRDGQVRGKIECSDSNRASEIPDPFSIPRANDKDPKDLFQARYNRNESGSSFFPPKPNMQQPSYSPYDPSGQKDSLYPIAPTLSQLYYQQIPPKEDYLPEFNRASVTPELEESINIPDNMILCPVDSCRTLNMKKSFACSKCRIGLHSPGMSIIPGIIQVEKWYCSQCLYKNTTAQGRPRICEACNTTNPMPGSDFSPQSRQYYSKEYPTHEREQLYSNTKDTNPSFDQDPRSVLYHESPNYPDHIHKYPDPNPSYQNPSSSYQNRNPSFQMEKWDCSTCTLQNTTAQGRPRICEACNTKNSTSGPDASPQPSQHYDTEYPTHERERLYPNPSYQNPNPSYPNCKPSYPNPNPSYPNPNPSYQNPKPSYPNPNPSYSNCNPSYPNPNPSYQNRDQECEICIESYTANDMIQMVYCPHSICKDCYCAHFTNAVRNSAIKNWTCPVCSEPDIQQMEDPYYYFGLLSIVIQELCEGEIVKLFHQKVNESRPEFRWCPHCNCGFMGRDDMIKLTCPQPECQKVMCYRCKRKWEDEHEERTCEEFQQWREENDRDILDKGLAVKLVEEGVECPCCKFKYELVRGGCMHFRCSQCPAEFCYGCYQLFKKDNCKKFTSCANKGLHAHHPRNCMYHTRDMDVVKMKELLEKGGFQRDEAVQEQPPPQPAEPDEGAQPNPPKKRRAKIYKARVPEHHLNAVIDDLKTKEKEDYKERPQGELQIPCQIVEFRENPDGGFDKENCVKFSLEKDGYAGLCEKHYKEYLCGFITNDGLDPIDVLEVTENTIFELWAILKRNEIPFNEKMKGDELKLLIKEELPLQPMTVARLII